MGIKMAPILYVSEVCAPVRAVLLVAAEIGIKLEKRKLRMLRREHLQPWFIQKNPQHTLPTLEDGDFIIWDSHAIAGYLVAQYALDDTLYPMDPKKRAVVDQRLHFDTEILYSRASDIGCMLIFEGEIDVRQDKIDALYEGYYFMEQFLQNSPWLAGDHMTIADLCCLATISSTDLIFPIAKDRFPKLYDWFKRCKALPYYGQINGPGLNVLRAIAVLPS